MTKKTRFFFAFYITLVFYIILLLHLSKDEHINEWVYSLGIPIFILSLILPNIMRRWFPKSDKPLQRTLLLAFTFWFFSSLAWFFGLPSLASDQFSYLAYFTVYGGLFGIVEGVYQNPIHPQFLKDKKLTKEGKKVMLEFENEKWWRGLNLFWVVIIAIAVSGVINWVLTESAPSLMYAFFLAFSSVPAIAMIVWNIIKRTNYIHSKIGELYKESKGRISGSKDS